jgi:hypothetical protein
MMRKLLISIFFFLATLGWLSDATGITQPSKFNQALALYITAGVCLLAAIRYYGEYRGRA